MATRLSGKVAVITGAGSGIGAATARRFAQEGATLVLSDLNDTTGRGLAEEVGAAAFIAANVTDPARVEALMQAAVDRCGALHIVCNNAGIGAYGTAPDLEIETWKQVVDVDLTAVFYGCKYAIPHLRKAGGGAVVNTASISGLFGDYGLVAYNAAKAGVVNLTRTVALDHARESIRVNCVCPGAVLTNIGDSIQTRGALDPEVVAAMLQRNPKISPPEDVARAIVFLASDDAASATGAVLPVDGGSAA